MQRRDFQRQLGYGPDSKLTYNENVPSTGTGTIKGEFFATPTNMLSIHPDLTAKKYSQVQTAT